MSEHAKPHSSSGGGESLFEQVVKGLTGGAAELGWKSGLSGVTKIPEASQDILMLGKKGGGKKKSGGHH